MWLFGWPAPWTDLFKVDILNCMGFAIAVMSVMALFRTVERAGFAPFSDSPLRLRRP